MKRLLTIFVALLSFVVAEAQTQGYSIIIDEESFAPVQTDVMSGVAIDKIGKDTSQRPCARLKMRVNRMTATEIDQLKVMVIGGNVVVMKHYVAAEGNGLIVELTAKQPTRFYLHHDKYGDSNEVSLNLEGDKEYKLSAQLNAAYPIFVNCDVEGAEVYVDNLYKGTTDANYTLTVKDIAPGRHTLKVKYGSAVSEQDIEVTSENLAFRMNVNVAKSRPQYVVFQVVPRNAVVVVDKKNYVPDAAGVVTLALHNGTYGYEVLADEYHPESGTFVVSGAKVEREVKLRPAHGWLTIADSGVLEDADIYVDNKYIGKTPIAKHQLASGVHSVMVVKELYHTHKADITIEDSKEQNYAPKLSADFATVTLDAGKGFDIYVNNELKDASPWTGRLATGAYIFEARKKGHRPTILTQSISATPAQQSYRLDAPTPIVGTLNIVSTPALAEVFVDGALVGRTPLMYDAIIGDHEIEIKANGYRTNKQSVIVAEGEFRDLNIALQEGSDQPVYAIGDLIDVNGVKGVVFYMDDNVVKAVSVESTRTEWSTDHSKTNAQDNNDGMNNINTIKSISGWERHYPAFKWCADLGEGWYLPARNELQAIYDIRETINSTLKANGYSELATGGHWSSTVDTYGRAYLLNFSSGGWGCSMLYTFDVRSVVALKNQK
ncbi:MAG: PEGA domain-containing protein [Alistipes sp.]|nr:PEGA domain-containing protein [Alistipes sp.]